MASVVADIVDQVRSLVHVHLVVDSHPDRLQGPCRGCSNRCVETGTTPASSVELRVLVGLRAYQTSSANCQ